MTTKAETTILINLNLVKTDILVIRQRKLLECQKEIHALILKIN